MIKVSGIKGEGDRRRAAIAIVGAVGIAGVCQRDPEIVAKSADCGRWYGGDRCRWCAVENGIEFED